jgi:AraC-like DNA-binding protein
MKTKYIAKRTNDGLDDRLEDRLDIPRPLVALAFNYPDGRRTPLHRHRRSQLIQAIAGVMTVTTEDGLWVIPPGRGVWVPAGLHHRVTASGELKMRTLYLDPACATGLPERCCAVSVPPLLRELILYAVAMPALYPSRGPEARIVRVIMDFLNHELKEDLLALPIPKDGRLKRIFLAMSEEPDDNRTLEAWGRKVGATGRTLARLFKSETGMSFHVWRQQLRILEALKGLAQGESVTSAAIRTGYDSPSAFISMFRRALGKTPGDYFR